MLQSLHITNYALIDQLSIRFYPGFNIITGETGAGKSIILGALGLILGQRADMGVRQDKDKKCSVEGTFRIKGYQLEHFFDQAELDYDEVSILRREITPSGKSRAFINDTPVNLKVLQDLSLRLIDIHSQHQNLELGNRSFQLKLVDLVAGNEPILKKYTRVYEELLDRRAKLASLKAEAERAKADLDYYEFQFKQLDEARLKENEQKELETEQAELEHAGEIKTTFGSLSEEIENEEYGILLKLKGQIAQLSKLAGISPQARQMKERLESCYFELKDLAEESASLSERAEHNPDRMAFVSGRLDTIYTLQQKFRVGTVPELIALRDELAQKILQIASFDEEIKAADNQVNERAKEVREQAHEISERRKGVSGQIAVSVVEVLQKLGMVHADFRVHFEKTEQPGPLGIDDLQFLFSSNRNSAPQDISKIASGGEISRVMLALKTLITDSKSLPTIVFDEIDTGISGEVAVKTGSILKAMAGHMQVINITHLPQIAGKGQHHFKVYKYETPERTFTSIRELNEDERIDELAQMLSGEKASDTARKTARELLD
ncbi:MAG: DNA repair protein RecN [Prolixibacteraceae bacterium]